MKEWKKPFNKISKDTLIYVPAFLIPAFINVFSLVVFTRIFEAGDYGEYSLVLATTTFLAILQSEWITQSVQRYLPQNNTDEEKRSFYSYLRFLIVSLTSAFMIVSIAMYPLIKPLLKGFTVFYWPAVVLIVFQMLFALSGGIFQSELKSKEFSIYRILNVSLRLLVSLGWIYFYGKEIIGLIWGAVITFGLILIPMLKKCSLLDQSGFSFRRQKAAYKRYFLQFIAYGFPMMGWYIGTSILDISDRYLLKHLGSSEDVGIYSANYNLISASLGLVTAPLLTASQPVIMKMVNKVVDDLDKIKNVITHLSRIYLLAVLPFIAYVTVFREEITFLLLGKEYREGAVIIPILLIAFSLWNFSMYGQIGHMIKEKTPIMVGFVFIAAAVNILLNFVLIPLYGYRGAALSTLFSFMLYPLFIYYSSRKFIPWKLKWDSFMRTLIISTFTGISVSQLKGLFLVNIHPFIGLIIGFCIGLIMYITLLFAVKELNQKEIQLLKGFVLHGKKSNKTE
ncbi:oligosaccharide flippase family protein [Bacillus sp. ISL-39]|uniref:oligosaccharide flippase family protein n=1 Tax=Bacillus sp. ISL-39 TaxID=2819124 RepID=UPI001BE933AF|nr:oligosaccharide flippase family protein [Bacillus sp. ISL-39]MBT2639686.1 polysaccharide biosynthesis protein [Bacillus sp. ISL-39]